MIPGIGIVIGGGFETVVSIADNYLRGFVTNDQGDYDLYTYETAFKLGLSRPAPFNITVTMHVACEYYNYNFNVTILQGETKSTWSDFVISYNNPPKALPVDASVIGILTISAVPQSCSVGQQNQLQMNVPALNTQIAL